MTRPSSDDNGSFIERWSRRKRQGGVEDQSEAEDPPREEAEGGAAVVAEDDGPGEERPVLRDEDMPPLDTLHAASDLSGFMSGGVSEELRRAALRRVFRMAAFQHRDGLDDYDGDYTTFTPLGDTVTADMRFHEERLSRKAREAEEAAARGAAESMPEDADRPPDEQPRVADDAGAERLDERSAGDEPDEDHDEHSDHPDNGAARG